MRTAFSARRLTSAAAAALLLAGGSLLLTPTHAAASSFTVTTTTDAVDATPGDGTCDISGGGCSLRAALQEANASLTAATITVPAGTYTLTIAPAGLDDVTTGDLNITGNALGVTINGAGAGSTIIDGNNDDHIFTTEADFPATLTHMTMQHGHASGRPTPAGGAVLASGDVTVTDSVIAHNTANTGGGLGANNNATMTLTRVVVDSNAVTEQGGGVWTAGGSDAQIDSSTISNNTANTAGQEGGGLDVDGTMTVTNSTIVGNSTNGWGGGVSIDGSFTATNVTITGNTALGTGTPSGNGHGGGIDTWTNAASLTNVTISGNTAASGANLSGNQGDPGNLTKTTLTNSIISDPLGGGLDCESKDVTDGGSNLTSDASCFATVGKGDKVNTDPKLGALANNGGPTQTEMPQSGSPAIDAVQNTCPPPATDQRGVVRPIGPACDMGAVEAAVTPTPTPTPAGVPVPATGAVHRGGVAGGWSALPAVVLLALGGVLLLWRRRLI